MNKLTKWIVAPAVAFALMTVASSNDASAQGFSLRIGGYPSSGIGIGAGSGLYGSPYYGSSISRSYRPSYGYVPSYGYGVARPVYAPSPRRVYAPVAPYCPTGQPYGVRRPYYRY